MTVKRMILDEAVRQRWAKEREADARQLAAIRDTLTLVDPEPLPPLSRARAYARQAEQMAVCIEGELVRYLSYCPKCEECDLDVRFSGRWTVRCRACGWTVSGETLDEAGDAWNAEEGDRCPSRPA